MDDLALLPAHLKPLAQAAVSVQPWLIMSVATLQHQIPREPSVAALRLPDGVPDAWAERLMDASAGFIQWVRWPSGPDEQRAEILAHRAARLLISLVALFRWAPELGAALELELVNLEDLTPIEARPLAAWWSALLERVAAAAAAAAGAEA